MNLIWVDVADTGVKIGLGAFISALAAYVALNKSQSYKDGKKARTYFYKLQEEIKLKYVDLLASLKS